MAKCSHINSQDKVLGPVYQTCDVINLPNTMHKPGRYASSHLNTQDKIVPIAIIS